MSDFYYLYDPADNLALGQAIHLANTDGGMSYIVPFAVKTGTVDPSNPASAGLGVIETAIAAGPLHVGGTNDPVSNRLTPAEFQGKVSADQWTAIKAMVKDSISQAPPAGWLDTSLNDAASTFTVISSKGYSQLATNIFDNGSWYDADTSSVGRGNPYVAYGGLISDSTFVDYAGHFVALPGTIGEVRVYASGDVNTGEMYVNASGSNLIGTNGRNPAHGLEINAPGKSVTIANFSATQQGFGPSGSAHDSLPFRTGDANGVPLLIRGGDVLLTGDLVVDQVTQVVNGTSALSAPIQITGASSKVSVNAPKVYLGAVRGYKSLISVENNASLAFSGSEIYGFSSSNSDAGTLPREGLDWPGFESANGSLSTTHLITAQGGGSILLDNTQLFREDEWQPTGEFAKIFDSPGRHANWALNDYRLTANGDLMVAAGGKLEIKNSKVLGSIRTALGAGDLKIEDSVVAGTPLGSQRGQSLVQLEGGNNIFNNSLIDSLDARFLSGGSLSANGTTHVLASATPWAVSTTTDAEYTSLASFAGPTANTALITWGDKENTNAKINFQFQGPQGTQKAPSSAKQRTLPVLLSESALPQVAGNGATTFSLAARFLEPVSGFDNADLQTALGTTAVQAGWQVATAPVSRDGGRNWSFQLTSPVGFSTPVTLNLAAGAANSALVSGLASDASNSFSLMPLGSSSGGGGNSGSSGGGSSGGGSISSGGGSTGSATGSTSPGLDSDNLDESAQNNNGIVIDANKDGTPDANQSNVAGIRRVGDGSNPGDYAALAVAADYILDAVTLLPITNNQVQVSLPTGGSVLTSIPNGVTALLEPLEFFVKNVKPGATIEAELFIPDNFSQQTDAYMRFNYTTKRFEDYVDSNGEKLYQLLDEDADGKVDRVVFSLTDGDPHWDGDGLADGVIMDPGSPIDAQLLFSGHHKRDTIIGNLLGNTITGKSGNDHLFGDLGKDWIHGGKGHDRINGGEQGDRLIGGQGHDHFVYTSAADSSADNRNQQDEIRRFHHQDRLDLRRFDADTTATGKQAFAFIGANAFSGHASELRFRAGLLSADLDGDRIADFAVAIDGGLKASQLML